MKKYLLLLAIFALFVLFTISCGGIEKRSLIEEKAREAYKKGVAASVENLGSSAATFDVTINNFKIKNIKRDRPADVGGGYYYIQGEADFKISSKNDVLIKDHAWFRCVAKEDPYGDILVLRIDIFDKNPSV